MNNPGFWNFWIPAKIDSPQFAYHAFLMTFLGHSFWKCWKNSSAALFRKFWQMITPYMKKKFHLGASQKCSPIALAERFLKNFILPQPVKVQYDDFLWLRVDQWAFSTIWSHPALRWGNNFLTNWWRNSFVGF